MGPRMQVTRSVCRSSMKICSAPDVDSKSADHFRVIMPKMATTCRTFTVKPAPKSAEVKGDAFRITGLLRRS